MYVDSQGAPQRRGEWYFFGRRTGKQNQHVICARHVKTGEERVLIDPNVLGKDGLVALDWTYSSRNGRYIAYGLSTGGDEESTMHILEVATGRHLPEKIARTRHSSVAWKKDVSGFYYTRRPATGAVPKEEEPYHVKVFYHELGTDPKSDRPVEVPLKHMTDTPGVQISEDGRVLTLSIWRGLTHASDVYFTYLDGPEKFVPIIEGVDARSHGTVHGDHMYMYTDLDAPRGRLVRVDLSDPRREKWVELIPQGKDIFGGVALLGGRMIATFLKDVCGAVKVMTLEGKFERDIPIPPLATLGGMTGNWEDDEMYFGYTSFLIPSRIHRYEISSGKTSLYWSAKTGIDDSEFEAKQVRFKSKDGTSVPMFVVHKRGLKLDGGNPALITGYGGFNVSYPPHFSSEAVIWVENGGVFALPSLRGGAEYGEEWHVAGRLGKKQNVFDDFISAAEWLIDNKYTSPARLAISGGSNGGLLVGAALVQRPDLFAAVSCHVPVLDMLRYHIFRLARYWIAEYGDPDNAEHFDWLLAYSPVHNVKQGTKYPAVFVATAESDSRVDPMHARKFAAELQAANVSNAPILYWIERDAGHGMGSPLSKIVREETDKLCFLFWRLGMR
jgi:prolyl oligopeptidase